MKDIYAKKNIFSFLLLISVSTLNVQAQDISENIQPKKNERKYSGQSTKIDFLNTRKSSEKILSNIGIGTGTTSYGGCIFNWCDTTWDCYSSSCYCEPIHNICVLHGMYIY